MDSFAFNGYLVRDYLVVGGPVDGFGVMRDGLLRGEPGLQIVLFFKRLKNFVQSQFRHGDPYTICRSNASTFWQTGLHVMGFPGRVDLSVEQVTVVFRWAATTLMNEARPPPTSPDGSPGPRGAGPF
jgi:hypothetical protein